MRVWTVHLPPAPPTPPDDGTGRRRFRRRAPAPVLVREGFSVGAFLFGPFWLLAHRLWLPALLWFAAAPAAVFALGPAAAGAALPAVQFLLGCHARDLQRRRLARRGYAQAHVVAEGNEERALARLLAARPDLAALWGRAALA